MEVDSSSEEPSQAVVPQAKLKRSSSAPLLIGSPTTADRSPAVASGSPSASLWRGDPSSSCAGGRLSPLIGPASPVLSGLPASAFHPAQSFRDGLRGRAMSVTSTGGPHSPVVPRVHQIRAEEMEAVTVREAQQERELASKLLISQSWDDLCIDEAPSSCTSPSPSSPVPGGSRRLHSPPIFGCPSPGAGGGASPSATSRQCYSPSMLRSSAMRAPSSPSPTRVQRHRSQSPQLVLRPSALGPVKRKLSADPDANGGEPVERAKRMLTLEDSNAAKDSNSSSTLLLQVAPSDA